MKIFRSREGRPTVSGELDNSKHRAARRIAAGEDRRHLLHALKRELVTAANAPTHELSLKEVQKKGLLAVLRKLVVKKSIKPSFDC
jgi:hypothetical protein